MKQMYKEIAGIIQHWSKVRDRDMLFNGLTKELADYFERDNKKILEINCKCNFCKGIRFNKQQFLKDCGVGKKENNEYADNYGIENNEYADNYGVFWNGEK